MVPALELIDARIEQFDRETKAPRKVLDTIADNAANAGIVLGGRPMQPDAVDWRWAGALLYKNGVIEESGLGAAVLNHPGNGVAWLANKLAPLRRAPGGRRDRARRLVHPPGAPARPATPSTPTTARSARSRCGSSDAHARPTPSSRPSRSPGAQIGLWLGLADPYTAELCATAGFDWLLVDGEHGPNDLRSMLAVLQAVAPYPSHPVVRVPHGDAALIKQVLEIGATTLLVPMVETAEQARALVRATRYPPRGRARRRQRAGALVALERATPTT